MDEWQKEINWKVVAIEKIANRLLSDFNEISTALRKIEQHRNEIQKTVDRQKAKDQQFQQIVMKKTPQGLTFAHKNANWLVKQKNFYLPNETGDLQLTALEEVLKDKAKVDKALELYPEAFKKTADVQKTEAKAKKTAAPKKKAASKK